jgi:hypothetical protein
VLSRTFALSGIWAGSGGLTWTVLIRRAVIHESGARLASPAATADNRGIHRGGRECRSRGGNTVDWVFWLTGRSARAMVELFDNWEGVCCDEE